VHNKKTVIYGKHGDGGEDHTQFFVRQDFVVIPLAIEIIFTLSNVLVKFLSNIFVENNI
jgi:hypothetical protein